MKMNGRVYLTSMLLALSVAVFVPRAAAGPIPITPVPVGVGPADDLIVSFYYVGLLDLPFVSVSIDLGFSGWEAGEAITFDFFNDQVGLGGLNRSQIESGGIVNLTFITTDPNFVDGAFSVGMRLSSGSADLISATSTEDTTFPPVTVDGFFSSIPAIPEPGTVALVGLGLAALAFLRGTRCVHSGDDSSPSLRKMIVPCQSAFGKPVTA